MGNRKRSQGDCKLGRAMWIIALFSLPVLAFGQTRDQSINLKNSPDANDPGAIGWIVAHVSDTDDTSSMPWLNGRAAAPSGLKVQYYMENKYPRRQGLDDRRYPKDGFVTLLGPDYWKMYETWNKDFFGGSCTFALRFVKSDESLLDGSVNQQFQKYYFDIKGKNPDDDRCKRFIKSVQGLHWYAWAVAKHESRWGNEVYNQFAPRDGIYGKKGEPFYSPLEGNGWGLFQRDPTGGGLPTTTQQVWDWTENVRGEITELDSKLAVATRYWSRLRKNFPTQYAECPPPSLVVEGNTLTAEDVITMTCYNGTGNLGSISNVLVFSSTKPCGVGAGKRWQWHLPNAPKSNKPYVNLVMQQYNEG